MNLYNIVRDRYDYDEKTGWLTWKKNKMRAGYLHKSSGYRAIKVKGKGYSEHRIIWLWFYGYDPENEIDHKNRIKHCNWISNLREATRSCNNKNKGIYCNNKTGITGILKLKNGKYQAFIKNRNYKGIFLGSFNTLLDGAKVRYKAEVEYNYENCNSTSTALKYIKDNEPEWFNGEMQVKRIKKEISKKQSGVPGVCFHKKNNNWVVANTVNYKRLYLGSFIKLDDAVIARYKSEVKYKKTENSKAYDYLIKRNLI